MGKWYEVEKSAATIDLGGKCVGAIYTEQESETFGVVNFQRPA